MRILAIGLGGAGGRIADMLYRTDRRSSKVDCVEALAIDVDSDSLNLLAALPNTSKIHFSQLDIESPQNAVDIEQIATVDISEITARVHSISSGETDAVIICIGLGGSFGDIASHLITALRSTITEPIFGLVTLPCLGEGARISADAAEDIEILAPLLDGVIVFDNETWYKKIRAHEKTLSHKDPGFITRFSFKKKKEDVLSPTQKIYLALNDAIVRRISLILRAGEFKADGGIELAEVVLDSGEVLNTMRGMGFITIGYSVEQIPSNPLSFLKKWRRTGYFADEHQKKASRIVELTKQAIYHEISAPCDITSAHKALILIAGPSQELSMKGYMTVRKWIDRSIAGLETRSGDYPVTSTKFVAIIVMLSGLENIPRIQELKEIRSQYKTSVGEEQPIKTESALSTIIPKDQEIKKVASETDETPVLRDEMITVRPKQIRQIKPESSPMRDASAPTSAVSAQKSIFPESEKQHKRIIISKKDDSIPNEELISADEKESSPPLKKGISSEPVSPRKDTFPKSRDERITIRDQERQQIERELQKQRLLAIRGKTDKVEASRKVPKESSPGQKQETKKIVLQKKSDGTVKDISTDKFSQDDQELKDQPDAQNQEINVDITSPIRDVSLDTWLKDALLRKKDDEPESEDISLKDTPKITTDDALVHTDLKRDFTSHTSADTINGIKAFEQPREIEPTIKKTEKKKSDDDVTWGS